METSSIQFYKIVYQPNGKRIFKDIGTRAHRFEEAIQNPGKFLSGDRENIFVTIAECFNEPRPNKSGKLIDRFMSVQKYLPFDIDDIDTTKVMETLAVVRTALGLKDSEGYAICTGNGLQIFIGLTEPITDIKYFEETRPHYKRLCEKINTALEGAGLPGHSDDSVFKNTQVVRLPNTINRKPGKEAKEARYLNGSVKPIDFDLKTRAPEEQEDFINKATFDKIKIALDTEGVLEGCDYLKYADKNADKLTEPEWYAALGILAFLPNGRELCHKHSRKYPGYSHAETEEKIEQVLKNQSGPRTCHNIDKLWGKCGECPNFGKCKTPVMIRGENFIESAGRGFRKIKYKIVEGEDGQQKRVAIGTGAVAYDDFLKYFRREYRHKTVDGRLLFTYNGSFWEERHPNFIKHVAQNVIKNDTPKRTEKSECQSIVLDSDSTPKTWLSEYAYPHHVNFKNGVLDLRTLSLKEHDKKYGFFNIFPYEFKEAACPKTEEVVRRVLQEDPEAEEFFWRYLGACFDPFGKIQKSLFIIGKPATGKSTLAKVFETVFPDDVRSNLSLKDICNDNLFKFRSYQLYKKYVNIADEGVPQHALDMGNFKNAVSGGFLTYEKKLQDAFNFPCSTKFLVIANNYVKMTDAGKDFARKFEILTTNKAIPLGEQDMRYQTLWIPEEREGIAYKAILKYREMLEEFKDHGYYDLRVTPNMKEGKNLALCATGSGEDFFDRLVFTGADTDKISTQDLYAEYKEHCMMNSNKVSYSRKSFLTRLRTRYASGWAWDWDTLYGSIRTDDNKVARGLKGVKLLDEDGMDMAEKIDY